MLSLYAASLSAQATDYEVIFGDNWQKAQSFINENEHWMRPVIEKNDISYAEAVAVIFPELIRYSALRDKMEITLLKTLYINLGEEYANFSIGVFQMKPSFAEKILSKTPEMDDGRIKRIFKKKTAYSAIREFRSSVVVDLQDPRQQLNYLIAFMKLCQSTFTLPEGDEKIKFLATAYNYDFSRDEESIKRMENEKYFNTKLYKSENYSYSDISLFWYRKYISGSDF